MRNLDRLNQFREPHPISKEMGDSKNGVFRVLGPCGMDIAVIASHGEGWDHVSVSLRNRVPNYKEMCWVKEKFFEDYELAIQYHVPKKDHINQHPNCLHLWRPWDQTAKVPMPPKEFV